MSEKTNTEDMTFEDIYNINVNDKVDEKEGLKYLSWAWAWAEFKKIYPEATYEVKTFSDENCVQRPYMFDSNTGYMVMTSVEANGIKHEMWLPVMDGKNKAMKAEAYTYSTRSGNKTVEPATMFDVNKTIMRCLTKNLAMFGLGLYIYAGEDLPQPEPEVPVCLRPEVEEEVKNIKTLEELSNYYHANKGDYNEATIGLFNKLVSDRKQELSK